MRIQSNVSSLQTYNCITNNTTQLKKPMEKLSSGLRINRAADDAAGLAISEKMRAQIREGNRCTQNTEEGISLANTADGAMQEMTEILQSIRKLCVQGANGIYEDVDREMINMEVRAKLDELERICSSSNFNGIPLFEGKIRNYITETVNKLPDGFLAQWGSIGGLNAQTTFENAPVAQKSSVTMELNGVTSGADMMGRTFTLKNVYGSAYTFAIYGTTSTGTVPAPPGTIGINVNPSDTIEQVVQKISSATQSYVSATASYQAGPPEAVKFEAPLLSKSQSLTSPPYVSPPIANADGVSGNNMSVTCINEIPTLTSPGGVINYGNDKQAFYELSMKNLTSAQIDDLVQNTINVGNKVSFGFQIGGSSSTNVVLHPDASGNVSQADLLAAFKALGSVTSGGNTITFTDSVPAGKIKITLNSSSSLVDLSSAGSSITEVNRSPSSGTQYVTSDRANVTMVQTAPGSNESFAKFELKVDPSTFEVSTKPKSMNVNGYTFTFYDSSVKYVASATSPNPNSYSGTLIDVRGKTQAQIMSALANGIGGFQASKPISGTTITLTYPYMGAASASASGTTISMGYAVPGTGTSTSQILMSSAYLNMDDAKVVFNLSSFMPGGVLDKTALAKTGFILGSTKFQFTNGSPAASDYRAIDIASCTDYASIAAKIQAATGVKTVDTANGVDIVYTPRTPFSSKISYQGGIPGQKGLFAAGTQNFTGGTNVGSSFAELDFSNVNLSSINNTGFRVTCATCPSEYINVIFSNLGKDIPPNFEVTDPATGEKRTITNVVIDPSKATSSAQLVQAIVNQSTPQLKHFTGFRVSPDDPSVLIAEDKRWGDLKDPANNPLKGEVLSGVFANFEVELKECEEHLDTTIQIYVGSYPKHQWIDIRLPALSLENLKLDDPVFDLTDEAMASFWMYRTSDALDLVTSKRALIGADTNRLEYANSQISNSVTQMASSESRLRDMDMAKGVMQQVKASILIESSQAMLMQANKLPQSVLQMLS